MSLNIFTYLKIFGKIFGLLILLNSHNLCANPTEDDTFSVSRSFAVVRDYIAGMFPISTYDLRDNIYRNISHSEYFLLFRNVLLYKSDPVHDRQLSDEELYRLKFDYFFRNINPEHTIELVYKSYLSMDENFRVFIDRLLYIQDVEIEKIKPVLNGQQTNELSRVSFLKEFKDKLTHYNIQENILDQVNNLIIAQKIENLPVYVLSTGYYEGNIKIDLSESTRLPINSINQINKIIQLNPETTFLICVGDVLTRQHQLLTFLDFRNVKIWFDGKWRGKDNI